jgi:hypothetical protein
MRVLLLLLCAFSVVVARSNPFVPTIEPNTRTDSAAIAPKQLESEEIKLPPSARVIKSITITHQDSDGSINVIDREIDQQIDWRVPITLEQTGAEKLPRIMGSFVPIEEIAQFNRAIFYVSDDVIKVQTEDELVRSFFLPRPSRVVMDFNATIPFEPIGAELKRQYFTKIELSFHEHFYRAIITLDSYYPFSVERVQGGYLLGLN